MRVGLDSGWLAKGRGGKSPPVPPPLPHCHPAGPGPRSPSLLQVVVVFVIDGQQWTLDLRPGKGSLTKGAPEDKADITLTINGGGLCTVVGVWWTGGVVA